MSANQVRLSQSSLAMLNGCLEEMRNGKFPSVNFPLLLYGITNECPEFISYCQGDDIMPGEMEDSIRATLVANSVDEGKAKKSKKSKDSKRKRPQNLEVLTSVFFTSPEGKEVKVPVTEEVFTVYEALMDLVQKFSISQIEPLHFVVAMFTVDSKDFKDFFKDVYGNYANAKKYFDPEKILQLANIPFELAGFLSTLNDKINTSKPCEILMRDNEVNALWNIMLKRTKRNAVIVGEAGVGKTSLVEKIAYDIEKGTCPKEFLNFKVLSLDVNSLIAGTSYRGDAEKRIQDIIEFLQTHKDVILFIDEVHTILGAGSCYEGEMDLANALKPILARGDTIVIGATTLEEYEKYFQQDAALSRRFEKLEVEEPSVKDVYPMIANKLKALSAFHGVKISKEMTLYAIMIASCFAFDKNNPDKTLDLLDRAMVTAKRNGRKYVTKKAILSNFSIFFKRWENMDEVSKKITAYHEAGHYLVGKASGRLTNYRWLAISIMPADNYLGITVFEESKENTPFTSMDYYIDLIAMSLAGRAAEKFYLKSGTSGESSDSYFQELDNSGASGDLNTATKQAFDIVTKYGMGIPGNHRIYLNSPNYPMFSEEVTNAINTSVDKLIENAYLRAKGLLRANQDILEAIATALLDKHIMSEIELDAIWQDVVEKRKQ